METQPAPASSWPSQGIVFCIGLSSGLLEKGWPVIIKTLSDMIEQLLVTMPDTGVGCYLYNTSEGIAECVLPLNQVDVSSLKIVQSLFSASKQAGHHQGCLAHVLELVAVEFEAKQVYTNKKLFLFSDEEGAVDVEKLEKVYSDLVAQHVNVSTFFTQPHAICEEVFRLEDPIFDGPNTQCIDVGDVYDRVMRRKEVKRPKFRCNFVLGNGFQVAVRGYSAVGHERVSRYKTVSRDGHFDVNSRTKYVDAAGNPVDTVLAFKIGDEIMHLSDEEWQQVQFQTGLRLRGFINNPKMYQNCIDRSVFVVPDESSFEGSTRTLAALHKSMSAKNKVALCWGKLKDLATPGVYLMEPWETTGFHLHRIPFLDEIRRAPQLNFSVEAQIEKMSSVTENILKYFSLKNGYPMFKNPSLAQHYNVLKARSLGVPLEHVRDETLSVQHLRQIIASNPPLQSQLRQWNTCYNSSEL